jgi:hypothetical protein
VSKTPMKFTLAVYSYITEHSGCHHCFIWWDVLNTNYNKIHRPNLSLLRLYDAENNFLTSVWLVIIFFPSVDCIGHLGGCSFVNYKLGRIWKEEVVA